MAIQKVDTPYEHDVQTNGTPMVPYASNSKLGGVPVVNPDGTAISAGGGGGGGAVTVADGADVAQGTTTDAATANTVIGRLKKLIALLPTALGSTTSSASLPVVVASDQAAVATKLADGVDVNAGTTTDASVAAGASGTMAAKLRRISADIGSILTRAFGTTLTYGSYTAMTVTNLQSLASSATAGWQSARVDNQTATKALDYEVVVKLTTANTAPANDKAAYVYLSPAVTTDGGTTWLHADQGTTTLPTGSEGTTTIASPSNLKLLGVLSYTTQNMTIQGTFMLSNAVGSTMPDGFSIILINFTGAALSTGCVVAYRPVTSSNA